ncbi:unannotated protein [freshwater metagenome]|uniref:Unannotated protein n=1 Tax=freshwater metagenome TaxID=449393 RepID=A0A6J7FBN2_9ZZZZ|nr:hypothetical protein [Actinomycetota bacterium]
MASSDPVRVLHTLEPGFGWHFVSPDVTGMIGGGTTYTESRDRAEYLVRVHISGPPHENPEDGRTAGTVSFAHFIDEAACPGMDS